MKNVSKKELKVNNYTEFFTSLL